MSPTLNSMQRSCHCWSIAATHHNKYYCYFQVKEKVPHWTHKTLSVHSIFFDLRQEARCPFVVTHYRFAFPLWWALWLCRWLLRRRGLLLLLGGVDHYRCRLDRRRILRLSWIVSSRCKVRITQNGINEKKTIPKYSFTLKEPSVQDSQDFLSCSYNTKFFIWRQFVSVSPIDTLTLTRKNRAITECGFL